MAKLARCCRVIDHFCVMSILAKVDENSEKTFIAKMSMMAKMIKNGVFCWQTHPRHNEDDMKHRLLCDELYLLGKCKFSPTSKKDA